MMKSIMRASDLFSRGVFWKLAVLSAAAFIAAPECAASSGGAPQKYGEYVRAAAQKHGLEEELIHSVIEAESNYNAAAVSAKGAVGLMQLIPETAFRYGVSNIYDPQQNIDAGVRYLKDLLTLYKNDLRTVLAAYNAGPEAVKKHKGIPPFPETKNYIRKVLRIYNRLGGVAGGRLYAFRDNRGKVLLTSDRFYLDIRSGSGGDR